MNTSELYSFGADVLKTANIENADFDARCLLEKTLKIEPSQFFMQMTKDIKQDEFDEYYKLLNRRVSGEPLQYILEKWYFMDFEFNVGKGVLIPRQDTETLVEFALEKLKNVESPKILDLCSGSGCIAISLAKYINNSQVFAFELSDEAIGYIEKNIELNNAKNVKLIKHDILLNCEQELPKFDIILSNPPYIPTKDMHSLQSEVKLEPSMALDGGEDGLIFYRRICDYWSDFLKLDGILAVECGINQSNDIQKIFSQKGFNNVFSVNDLCGIERVIVATNLTNNT